MEKANNSALDAVSNQRKFTATQSLTSNNVFQQARKDSNPGLSVADVNKIYTQKQQINAETGSQKSRRQQSQDKTVTNWTTGANL